MKPITMAVALLTLAACSDSPSGPSANLSGSWEFFGSFSNAQLATSCNATGTANLTQTGNSFTGTAVQDGECNGPGGAIDNSGSGAITGGQISGNNVSFQFASCSYTGSFSGNPPNQMSGTTTCQVALAGQTFQFTGNWQAGR